MKQGIILFLVIFFFIFVSWQYEKNSYQDDVSQEYYDRPTYNGYDCTDDCSGHEAGYQWAAEKGITDPDECGGNSDSFIEGCISYTRENSYVENDPYADMDDAP